MFYVTEWTTAKGEKRVSLALPWDEAVAERNELRGLGIDARVRKAS
jgi:hypothetical protein